MSYTWPVKEGTKGWGYNPPIHWGLDIIPKVKGSKQKVLAARSGNYKQYIGGICKGFDWIDDTGKRHRYCHVDYIHPSKKFKRGDSIARMDIQGWLKPWWYTHLHWVVWLSSGRTIDPMQLDFTKPATEKEKVIIPLFKAIWHRSPAKGEILYFKLRWTHENWDRDRLINTMKYWYGVVYRGGKLNKAGNQKWQRSKNKIIKQYN